jgi:hypothetical protein
MSILYEKSASHFSITYHDMADFDVNALRMYPHPLPSYEREANWKA